MRQSLARDNGRKITAMLQAGTGHADLYRTTVAGPSGQRRDTLIARVRYLPEGPYEVEIISMDGPYRGETVGYARRANIFEMGRHPGAEWSITDYSDWTGYRWLGYASSLALGCDVLRNGVHAATGRHDSARISAGTWIPNRYATVGS
jgi:hypothetical protein